MSMDDNTEGQPGLAAFDGEKREDAPGLAAFDGDNKDDVEGHLGAAFDGEKDEDAPGMQARFSGEDDVEGQAIRD